MSDDDRYEDQEEETTLEDAGVGVSNLDGVLSLIPLQDAPRTAKNPLKVARGPGRPRKVERAPQVSDLEYHRKMIEEKARFVEADELVTAIKGRADAIKVLQVVKENIAREAACLKFQQIENEKRGKDTAQISSRRIEAMQKLANLEFEVRKLGTDMLDLKSEKMQKVFSVWVETLQEIAGQVLPPESVDLLFNRLSTALQGWEDKASEAVKGA